MNKKTLSPLASICAVMLVAGAIFLMGVLAAHAQPAPPGPPPPRPVDAAELARPLKLTPAQIGNVQTILDADHRAMREFRESMRTKHDAIEQSTAQKLAKVLDAEQMGRYQEWKQSRRPDQRREGHARREPD